jgi:hypothetical protein
MLMAMKEWDQDTRATGIMTEQRFIDALFSTVDLWYRIFFFLQFLRSIFQTRYHSQFISF